VTKDAATQVTYFVYSEQALMGELDKDGKLQRAYGFDPVAGQQGLWSTDPVWQAEAVNSDLATSQTDYHYLHTDHLGTPHMATDKTGVVTWKIISEAFGSTDVIENSVLVNLRFPGQYWDAEKQTSYNFHRDYKGYIGRYLQEDPIGIMGGINFYNYVGGRVLGYMDPIGLSEVTGEWINQPKLNIVDYGINGFSLVSPSWSWWGYVQFIRLHVYANGYINIDVRCTQVTDCGSREWNIHQKIPLQEKAFKDFGPNIYALGIGFVTSGFVGVAANILIGGLAALDAGAEALSELNKKAGARISLISTQGPTSICTGPVF
jgi:RHS repeat-associated protein